MVYTTKRAFTLVELIVVITILAVLATVAFISFQGYSSSSRDSVRLADLKNISKSFELMKTKDQELPLPDQKVDISNSGTIFQYQGVLEEQTLKISNIHNGGLDPLTGDPYGYAVNAQRNKFQIIGFLENSQTASNNLLSQSLADNSDKFIKTSGDTLGVLLDPTTNEIVTVSGSTNTIDLSTNTTSYFFVLDEVNSFQGVDELKIITQQHQPQVSSCRELLDNDNSLLNQDGYYPIFLNGKFIVVYCNMTFQGGGWTRTFYSDTEIFPYDIESNDLFYIKNESVVGQNNFSILYSFAKQHDGNEFYLTDSSGDFLHFTQDNKYNESPDGNNFTSLNSQFSFHPTFTDSGPYHGLFLGKYGANSSVQNYCILTTASNGNSWTNCLRDDYQGYKTGPWNHTSGIGYTSGSQQYVEVYQR